MERNGEKARKENRPLGRPERRWEGIIKIDLRVIEWRGMD
jgi:hypothetical protein